jgi:hypothetical protein
MYREDKRRPQVGARGSDDRGGALDRPPPAPPLPDDIDPAELHGDVRAELLPLARGVAEVVARHLVAAGRLIDDDPTEALEHAVAARRLAARIPAVREAVGIAAYRAGEWQTAIAELRTYHRLSGRHTHLALLADCERALGRPERAIDLYRGADRTQLDPAEALELLIVAAGARADLGQHDAAVAMLQVKELSADEPLPWVARLRYAYADALLAAGRQEESREWFARTAAVDEDSDTDAADRLLELDGVVLDDGVDLDEEDAAVDDEEDSAIDEEDDEAAANAGDRETDRVADLDEAEDEADDEADDEAEADAKLDEDELDEDELDEDELDEEEDEEFDEDDEFEDNDDEPDDSEEARLNEKSDTVDDVKDEEGDLEDEDGDVLEYDKDEDELKADDKERDEPAAGSDDTGVAGQSRPEPAA